MTRTGRVRQSMMFGVLAMALLGGESSAQQRPPTPVAPVPPQPTELQRPPQPVTTNLPGRGSPPQPQQEQSLTYFQGSWSFQWRGRESPFGAGPRSGTVTFSPASASNTLTMSAEGVVEDAGTFKESGTLEWNPATKTLTIREALANGVRLTSSGDWSSPLAIRSESQPVGADGDQVRLRRRIDVISADSFSVTDDISTNRGPWVRLGTGTFQKK
jgi:hypothetical protein